MKININTSTKIEEVQNTFNTRFPFLKIEFFKDVNKPLNADNMLKDHQIEIRKLASLSNSDGLEIHGSTTVVQLENAFNTQFGVLAQVFHKRGQSWILTTTSDASTLDALNLKSNENTKPLPKEEITDSTDRMDLE
jgi:hypothetical protein